MDIGRVAHLHEATTELVGATDEQELYRLTVDAAEVVLEFDYSYLNIADGDRFDAVAMSPPDETDRLQSIPIDHGVTGATYARGESFLIDDVSSHPLAEPVHDFQGSAISVPVGEFGVFQAVSEEAGVYDETDLELAELLAAYAAETLARIRSERELERQNERLDEFASIVSHDLRNPLAVATGTVELALETGSVDRVANALDALERMDAIIEDVLTLARHGRSDLELEPVDLETVGGDAWRLVETADASLRVRDGPTILADPERIERCLQNLFRNAVEHGGPDVTVTVGPLEADADENGESQTDPSSGDAAGFHVADDGPGIPPAEREQVFESGYTTRDEGTGYGLTIVRRIVDAHGWSITVTESEAGGARFEIETGG